MKIQIRKARQDDLKAIVDLAARLNSLPESRCLHMDSTRQGIESEISDLDYSFEDTFIVATCDDRIVGTLGADCDEDGACVWLLGPFAEGDECVAEALLQYVHSNLPSWVWKVRQYLDERNVRGINLHKKLGYKCGTFNQQYGATKGEALWQVNEYATEVTEESSEALKALHKKFFPQTWLKADELIGRCGSEAQAFVTCGDGEVTGYIFVSKHSGLSEGTLEYVAVQADRRGMGLGRVLLCTGLRWLFEVKSVERVQLVVETEKKVAQKLYESCGLRLLTTGVAMSRER